MKIEDIKEGMRFADNDRRRGVGRTITVESIHPDAEKPYVLARVAPSGKVVPIQISRLHNQPRGNGFTLITE